MVVLISAMFSNALSETQTERVSANYAGIWVDPNYDREELVILPQDVCWEDDLMGEEARENGFMMNMNWSSSATVMWNYHMTGTVGPAGTLQYTNGLAANYTFTGSGELDVDETGILEDNGIGEFMLGADGTLTWKDSYMEDAGKMVFRREKTPVFSAEEAAGDILKPVLMLETGTAGSSLKLAELVRDIYSFCSVNLLWNMDRNAYESALRGAMDSLNESEQVLFREKAAIAAEELERLQKENEELGAVYEDADVDEQMLELREDPSIRLSVKMLTDSIKGL